jgi:hypothetical protein|tara:strand:+ start:1233 stop:1505 length:273 start_codon:yes stop_codon:yes gene_type:complete
MGHISKTQENRWFVIQDNESGEPGIILFGHISLELELDTGQPNLTVFLTEDELEIEVNNTAGIANYYKDAVESGSDKFQGESGKYSNPPE